jgi:hypothetical protein
MTEVMPLRDERAVARSSSQQFPSGNDRKKNKCNGKSYDFNKGREATRGADGVPRAERAVARCSSQQIPSGNDRKKNKCNSKSNDDNGGRTTTREELTACTATKAPLPDAVHSRFPPGMTERKTSATAKASTTAIAAKPTRARGFHWICGADPRLEASYEARSISISQ